MIDSDRADELEGGEANPLESEEPDESGELRDDAGEQRDQAAVARDHGAQRRDRAADRRDRAAEQRDDVGERRDRSAEQRDRDADRRDRIAEQSEALVSAGFADDTIKRSAQARQEAASDRRRASQDRGAGAGERSGAELDRETALADRAAGASERGQAERDRETALGDRGASARHRENSSHDDLTGAYLRDAGRVELEREMARAKRTKQSLVLAFVDVDHLKLVNDSRGHAAGDRMLLAVANALRAKLRTYDLVIRYGGDEFLCAISSLSMADATTRLALVNAALAEADEPGSVSVGVAELRPDDTPEDLVARADAELYRAREQRRTTRD